MSARALRWLLLICLLLVWAGPNPAAGEEEEVAWQPDEVARAGDVSITWDDLCRGAVEQLASSLDDSKSTIEAAASFGFQTLHVIDPLVALNEVNRNLG